MEETSKCDVKDETINGITEEEKLKEVASNNVTTERNAPDGGYGWFILLGCFLMHLLQVGLARSFGVFYMDLSEMFQSSSAVTGGIISTFNVFRMTLGPVASVVCSKYSIRKVVFIGSLVQFLGCFLSSFVGNIWLIYLSFGILGGIGGAFIFTPSYLILTQYFDKKRGKAMAWATIGSGFGMLVQANLINYLLDTYSYRGAMLITSAILLNCCVGAALYRPLHTDINTKKVTSKLFNFSILKNIYFIVYALVIISMPIMIQTILTFLADFIKEHCGVSGTKASLLLSITGLSDMIGRFFFGFLFDLAFFRRFGLIKLESLLGIVISITAALFHLSTQYWLLMIIGIVWGIFEGGFHSQRTTILLEIVKPDEISQATGFSIFFQSIGNLIGVFIGGSLRDLTGSYFYTFLFAALVFGLSNILLLLTSTFKKKLSFLNCTKQENNCKDRFEIAYKD
ncbi:unnamed protein product [Dimorphilus gyrociliatus]|uniref:Major facilitator superfamily (MFS) profile domain-containing protein n=1 Tax=Dimorphilus gyrociliatus TaxID=2664684 RepID=A0A7I8VH96_9ANNE|nr:unnamed protein product [Dimorphilus gyrociliatus]